MATKVQLVEKDSKVAGNFNKLWGEQTNVSLPGKVIFKFDRKKIMSFMKCTDLNLGAKIVDVGCGTGGTLRMFRSRGYYKTIGIDVTESSMKLCEANGYVRDKDVFLVDVNKSKFKNGFDMVFAEGVIEHYVEIQPVVNSICGMSKKYVLTTMPNLSSISWKFFELALKIMGRWHVDDFEHSDKEYISAFKKAGFRLVKLKKFSCNRGWIMLFEKAKRKK